MAVLHLILDSALLMVSKLWRNGAYAHSDILHASEQVEMREETKMRLPELDFEPLQAGVVFERKLP